MNKRKLLFCTFGALLLFGVVAYYMFWFSVAAEIERQIDLAWDKAQVQGVTITGQKPRVKGFPGYPQIYFSGFVYEQNGTQWTLPAVYLRGFPVPGFDVALEMPQGMSIGGKPYPHPVELDRFFLSIHLPSQMPASTDVKEIRAWQQSGHVIPVNMIAFKVKEMMVQGQGQVGLDERLQITGQIMTRVVGFDSLLADLTEKGMMKGKSAVMAQSFLQIINQKDPKSGETFFDTPIRIQNHGVFLGPLRVATLAPMVWEESGDDRLPTPHRIPSGPESLPISPEIKER